MANMRVFLLHDLLTNTYDKKSIVQELKMIVIMFHSVLWFNYTSTRDLHEEK